MCVTLENTWLSVVALRYSWLAVYSVVECIVELENTLVNCAVPLKNTLVKYAFRRKIHGYACITLDCPVVEYIGWPCAPLYNIVLNVCFVEENPIRYVFN